MMDEVRAIDAAVGATERLFVVDSMAGQDAVRAAQSFNDALDLTGVILTKADGDARGGAALSVRQVTGKPILFVGVGEKTDALEAFHPERIASRILGMGDVLSLIEQVQTSADQEKAAKLAAKLTTRARVSTSPTCASSLPSSTAWAGLQALASKLPNQALPPGALAQVDESAIRRQLGIIDSMTPHERRRPAIIAASRKRRIAAGAGVPGPGGQPPAQAVHADGKSHEEDEGRGAAQADAEPLGAVPGRTRPALRRSGRRP